MSRRLLAFAALSLTTALSAGCKKKTPTAAPVVEAPAPAPAPAPVEVPKQVNQMVENFSRVYFDFDASTLAADSKSALNENARIMQEHADIKLEIQGHADERGTTDYNLALGQRRATSVYKYLTTQGIAPTRMKVVSYGEERPLSSGHSETAWSKNRRAEFAITWGDTGSVKGTTDQP